MFPRRAEYFHEPSGQQFTIYERGSRILQRRHQTDSAGREINAVEMTVDFVLGSGEHARTFLHRAADGQLVELPLAWYSEDGGTWAMNPGYDRPDHMDFRRKLDRECFFCHNAYPSVADSAGARLVLAGKIPEGIDCQRCHGPGRAHVESAGAGRPTAAVRAAVVNPGRLAPERRNEVCFQCHLESTSRLLPYALRRYGRGFFSYRPGEPLSDYILHFDRSSDAGDDLEINHAAYRLLRSACFRSRPGGLTCTTCHDPHAAATGPAASLRYDRVCLGCHGAGGTAGAVRTCRSVLREVPHAQAPYSRCGARRHDGSSHPAPAPR